MTKPIDEITLSVVQRNAIKRGPTSSDAWNDSFQEVVRDLATIQDKWNNELLPLVSTVPDGTNDLNAYTEGLDGTTLYTDSTVVGNVNDTLYFNAVHNRPNTIKEQLDKIQTTLISLQQQIDALKNS